MICHDETTLSDSKALGVVLLVCLFCLVPFLNKAFHIDDPLFIWTAKQILAHPFDFYGFTVNWYGSEMPIAEIVQNPPLASYYIAIVAYWFGWGERTLHIAFLLPAFAVVIGTYNLAQGMCDRPLLATLVSISTPVFLLSSTTVMCDILMLAFWVFAVNFWKRGIQRNCIASLVMASLFITACVLTKYYGISLVPLLFVYSLAEKRKPGRWLVFLILPLLLLGAYQLMTHSFYGKDHFAAAATYALSFNSSHDKPLITTILTGIAFTGGCISTVLCYAPSLWRTTTLVVSGLLLVLTLTLALTYDFFAGYPIATSDGINWLFVLQFPLFVLSGCCFLMLVCLDYWHTRDADSLLIFLWIAGTVCFALLVNWTVNGRSILPLVPMVGILIVRNLQRKRLQANLLTQWRLYVPLVPAFTIALLVTWSDYTLANASRDAVRRISTDFGSNKPGRAWFEGHWGFQYYMQLAGMKPLDFEKPSLRQGDYVVIPSHNSGLKILHKHLAKKIDEYAFGTAQLLTMDNSAGAGFYADLGGELPLPFAVGHETQCKFFVLEMLRDKVTRFTY